MADLNNNVDAGADDAANKLIDHISGFNEDCLIQIFEELNFLELIKMSTISDRFYLIIKEYVIGRKVVDMGEIREKFAIRKAFKMFGENIVKLKISSNDLQYKSEDRTDTEEIFAIIQKFCSADKLRELELRTSFFGIKQESIAEFAPMLQNLQCFTLESTLGLDHTDLNGLFSCNTNLRVLRLRYRIFGNEFLDHRLFGNLTELSIEHCRFTNFSALKEYFRANQNLKKLSFNGNYINIFEIESEFIAMIGESLPNLESLDWTFGSMSVVDYDPILNLKNLKKLKIASLSADCHDIYQFLKKLAIKNTVEELIIVINGISHSTMDWMQGFPEFSSLRSVEIINPTRATEPFLTLFVKNLPNLTKCILRGRYQIVQSIIVIVVKHAMNLNLLVLLAPRNEISKIFFDKLYHSKMRSSNLTPLEVRVNKCQLNRFNDKYGRMESRSKIVKITSYTNQ